MNTQEKETKLKNIIDKMTTDELKALAAEAFIDGLEKGIKLQDMKKKEVEEKSA